MTDATILPFPVLEARLRRQRALVGSWALQHAPEGVFLILPGFEFCGSVDEVRFAGRVILEAFESGLTMRQIKELAWEMKEVTR